MARTQTESLRRILLRNLHGVRAQMDAYPDDASVWALPPGVNNSTGTLALHLAGNLRHFLGAQLGASGYVRDREAEFSRRDVPREEMRRELQVAAEEVDAALAATEDEGLSTPFPITFGDVTLDTGRFVTHLATHLAYHLGQIDLHRRVVTGEASPVPVLGFGELA